MGSIVTFYSYKGGVGRTMAVANIGVLLSRMGLRVLAVDWDLEAPGLDQYFNDYKAYSSTAEVLGLLDLLKEASQNHYDTNNSPSWQNYVLDINVGGKYPLSLITSGKKDQGYTNKVLSFDWNFFFAERDGGNFIESLRNEWRTNFDVTLIDSRTGITDSGGICTIQLPDILALVFTANYQSLNGVKQIALQAQKARQKLAFDRTSTLIFPLPSRFDSRAQYEESQEWLEKFAEELKPFYRDWLPKRLSPLEVLKQTKLPYIAYYSFGEKLPVVTEGTSDPEGIGHAYLTAAILIANDFRDADRLIANTSISVALEISTLKDSEEICPYKGLQYFDYNNEDPKYFFGREKLVDKLLDRVKNNNFLTIVGASGSGKSSVLRAGLLHQLKLGRKLAGSQDWKIQIMLPGEHPLQNLAFSWLDPNLSNVERASQLDRVESLLKQGGEGVKKLVQDSTANRVILVVDQFEEVFTLCQDLEERQTFLKCLLEALDPRDSNLCLILAMRIDFFGKCFEKQHSGLGNKIQNKGNFIAISPMEKEELKQAINKPAEKVNLNLELGLAEQIIRDLEDSPSRLPLLQYTLKEMWYQRQDNNLKLASYFKLGGIGGALNRRATKVYQDLSKSEQNATQHIFLSLTNFGDEAKYTSRRVLKHDLMTSEYDEKLVDNVIQKLSDEKLILTRYSENNSFEIDKQVEVEVVHEALIRNWRLLNQWLNEDRELLEKIRKIENTAQEWQAAGQQTDYLLVKNRLKEARKVQKEQPQKYPLSMLSENYIDASIRCQRKEQIRKYYLLVTFPLMASLIAGYFVVRETQLTADKKLIRDCIEKEQCPGRIEALERLVGAGKSLKDYQLSNTNLTSADFKGADFKDTKLENVILKGADLRGADFRGADFRGANLESTDLRGADFRSANLESTDLESANLEKANLASANFSNVDLKGANLEKANLENVNLRDADLKNASLQNADLESVVLEEADLENTNFQNANLRGADLKNANLRGANLKNADLRGANLNNTNLRNASLFQVEMLTFSQIKLACYWETAFYKGSFNRLFRQWRIDEISNQQFIEQLQQDKASNPQEPIDCSRWNKDRS